MDECISVINHPILNHHREEIGVTHDILKKLDMYHYLRRDRATGLKQLKPEYRALFAELEGGMRPSELMKMLGADWRCPNVPVVCRCQDCQRRAAATDNTPLPGQSQGSIKLDESRRATDLLVQEIKKKRKYR